MKTVAENRRVRYDYEILETIEAGVQLTGQEVKSCRLGHVQLQGAYLSFLKGRPVLKKMKISAYPAAGPLPDYDPERDRLLLLKASEIRKLTEAVEQKGIAAVPLAVHAGRFIKVVLALGRGKKKSDKRESIKKREIDRGLREKGDW